MKPEIQTSSFQIKTYSRHMLSIAILALGIQPCVAESQWVSTQTHGFNFPARTIATRLKAGEVIHIAVGLKLRNKSALEAMTAPNRGTVPPLSPQAFMQRFAPSQKQVQAVIDYLTRAGFTRVEVAPNRLLITADGNAASIRKAFNTEMMTFTDGERPVYANRGDAQVPADLDSTILSVLGLQNIRHAQLVTHEVPVVTRTQARNGLFGHDPMEFSGLYHANAAPQADLTKAGLIVSGNITQVLKDLKRFQNEHSLQIPVSTVIVGKQATDPNGTPQWDMQSQAIMGAAGGNLNGLIFYVAPTLYDIDLTEAYNRAVTDRQASVINISLRYCEQYTSEDGSNATQDQIFQAAIAQGQTFVAAAGDGGADECANGRAQQSYPAASPYVIAVGGTTLTADAAGNYVGETSWSKTAGGPATTEHAADWQLRSGVLGSSSWRGVPDIAFDADPASGAIVTVNGVHVQMGGTALAAPIFTGLWARLASGFDNQAGFAGSWLYQMGQRHPSAFRDITQGENGAFNATAGWDYVSGWGSLDTEEFSKAMNLGPSKNR
jgi:pseudomonalisin/xanthomonalisin